MSRIRDAFERRAVTGEKLFLPYLCAGDPDLDTSLRLARAAEEAGADILELGVPFSDPLADGPTIQKATQRSLDNGFKLTDLFRLLEDFRSGSDLPLVLMTYFNPVFRYGQERFLERAREAGADGVLVVDLPPEEGEEFYRQADEAGIDTVLLATPTTRPERVRAISEHATGFLYYVMVTGVTGVRSGYDPGLDEKITRAAEASTLPTVMGFGVSEIAPIRRYLDPIQGVVAGSTLVEQIERNAGDPDAMVEAVRQRIRDLARPLHGAAV